MNGWDGAGLILFCFLFFSFLFVSGNGGGDGVVLDLGKQINKQMDR